MIALPSVRSRARAVRKTKTFSLEFIVALTFLGQAHSDYTLPIYVTFFFTRGGAEWGPIMAASTLYTIPVVVFFLIVQRRMTAGLVAGAVKG